MRLQRGMLSSKQIFTVAVVNSHGFLKCQCIVPTRQLEHMMTSSLNNLWNNVCLITFYIFWNAVSLLALEMTFDRKGQVHTEGITRLWIWFQQRSRNTMILSVSVVVNVCAWVIVRYGVRRDAALRAALGLWQMHSKDCSFVNKSVWRSDSLTWTNWPDSTFHLSLVCSHRLVAVFFTF